MRLLFKIAFRNLVRHKQKSFAISAILFIGAIFISLGNGIITGTTKGIQENIINKNFGEIVVLSASQNEDLIANITEPIEEIGNYQEVEKVLERQAYIDRFVPTAAGPVMTLFPSSSTNKTILPHALLIRGIDYKRYQQMYGNNFTLIEGEPLKSGERGILLNEESRLIIYFFTNFWILPQGYPLKKDNLPEKALAGIDTLQTLDHMALVGLAGDAITNSSLPVKGVFRFNTLNDLLMINLVDLTSSRICLNYVSSSYGQNQPSVDSRNLLLMKDIKPSDIFLSEDAMVETSEFDNIWGYDMAQAQKQARVKAVNPKKDAYNMINVKLKPDVDLDTAVKELNSAFHSANIDSAAYAVSWKHALKYVAVFILFFRAFMKITVYAFFFVALIVVVNTLSMVIVERIYEIAMMRAVGATKGFMGNMLFIEAFFLCFTFGGLGLFAGAMIVNALAALNIPATNPMMCIAFGGDTFMPLLDGSSIMQGIVELFIITLIAMIYPILLVRKIQPLDGINRE